MNLIATSPNRSRDPHGNRIQPASANRHRALARLYERRAAVDQLIHALERYQRHPVKKPEQTQFEGF